MAGSHAFLIIRLSSMGDVLLATPFLRQVRSAYPHARIDMAVDDRFADIVRHNPHLDTIVQYRRAMPRRDLTALKSTLRASLPRRRYDAVIDLQKNRHSRRLRRRMGGTVYRIDKTRLRKLALVHLKKNLYTAVEPIAERYRRTARELRIDDDGDGLELWLPEEAEAPAYPPASRVQSGTRKRLAVAPGAHHATKRWLPERFAAAAAQLAREYHAELVLLGGTADRDVCREVLGALPPDLRVVDASGSTSVFDTARLLDTCDLLLTNDTGVMHIAAARRVPVVAVFGSTVQEFGFAPYRVPHRVVEVELPCRPCTHIGRARCPLGHFQCMRLVGADMVVRAAQELVAGDTGA